MLASKQLPVVFLAHVQGPASGQAYRTLNQECRVISQLLSQPRTPHYLPLHKGENLSTEYYLNLLGAGKYNRRITHLHLVGHADGQGLMMASEAGEFPLTVSDLCTLVDSLPFLDCVFLSGCATPELVNTLLKKDVPAIIATQAFQREKETQQIAHAFYQFLAEGESLRDAFSLTSRRFKKLKSFRVRYDVETDEMNGLPFEEDDLLMPWGLYYLQDNTPFLIRKPKARPLLQYLPSRNHWRKVRSHRLSFTSVALILGLIAVSLVVSLQASYEFNFLAALYP